MELTRYIPFLAMLACPIGMGVMMWLMMRHPGDPSKTDPRSGTEHLAALQEQQRRLAQEIAVEEQIVALEAEQAALGRPILRERQLQPMVGAHR